MLVICGSATSWIIDKVLKNKGGLHGRVTEQFPLEPVFFALGQVAGTAAAQALSEGVAVQNVDYRRLRDRPEQDGQILSLFGGCQK